MVWVTSTLEHWGCTAKLEENGVRIWMGDPNHSVDFFPHSANDAHTYALILRKCARRLEDVGRGLLDAGR